MLSPYLQQAELLLILEFSQRFFFTTRDFRRNAVTPVDDFELSHQQSTPSQVALRREVLDKIRSMLDEQDALAVDLMLENRNWDEIGQRLGIKPDTARMRVRRGLERVRKELGVGNETH